MSIYYPFVVARNTRLAQANSNRRRSSAGTLHFAGFHALKLELR